MKIDREQAAAKCLRLLLRPIVRFCFRNSLVLQEIVEHLKMALVEEASEAMRRSGQRVNVSRISVMTGVHRREVMRLTDNAEPSQTPASLASRVIGQWEQDSRFHTAAGVPRMLSYEGDQNDFKDLVRCVSQDLNHCTVLFELERIGAVERRKAGLRLMRPSVVLTGDMLEGFQLLGRDSEDLMDAALENILEKPKPAQLHARTEYDNISLEALPEIRQWLLDEGAAFHRRMREYLSALDKDTQPKLQGEAGGRVVVGTFGRVETRRKG